MIREPFVEETAPGYSKGWKPKAVEREGWSASFLDHEVLESIRKTTGADLLLGKC
jgi:hypothetical protein